jgi:hypothetical protein
MDVDFDSDISRVLENELATLLDVVPDTVADAKEKPAVTDTVALCVFVTVEPDVAAFCFPIEIVVFTVVGAVLMIPPEGD